MLQYCEAPFSKSNLCHSAVIINMNTSASHVSYPTVSFQLCSVERPGLILSCYRSQVLVRINSGRTVRTISNNDTRITLMKRNYKHPKHCFCESWDQTCCSLKNIFCVLVFFCRPVVTVQPGEVRNAAQPPFQPPSWTSSFFWELRVACPTAPQTKVKPLMSFSWNLAQQQPYAASQYIFHFGDLWCLQMLCLSACQVATTETSRSTVSTAAESRHRNEPENQSVPRI